MNNKINLHVHTTVSDGKKTPEEVASIMEDLNITFSITDHDKVDGINRCRNQLTNKKLLINGCELSCSLNFYPQINISAHILAYNFDLNLFSNELKKLKDINDQKAKSLAKECLDLGYKINVDNINSKTDLANELITYKYATNMNNAFSNIISKLHNYKNTFFSICDGIKLIHKCNGIAVLAHPFQLLHYNEKLTINEKEVESLVKFLVELGIDGIETYYSQYTNEQIGFLIELANKYNLKMSSGTDIHFKNSSELLFQENKNMTRGIL